jgi:antitoxin (DNA-binding transcriptional repressor) of toxin-antitoxin stability system
MYYMKTASIRDLRYHFPKIERMLAQGQEIQITKRKKVIGKLVPAAASPVVMPDFAARLKEIWGDRVMKVSGAEIISRDRDRY